MPVSEMGLNKSGMDGDMGIHLKSFVLNGIRRVFLFLRLG